MPRNVWMKDAERVDGAHPGGEMVGGPPRMVHHITWDRLQPSRPSYGAVRDYLAGKYDPHLLVDPFTGRVSQFLPFDRSAYALQNRAGGVQTNRMGDVCIQVEWYFSPGLVVNGKMYPSLAETPMHGFDEVLAVAREFGIPNVWPAGRPKWTGSTRDTGTWLKQAGHYGHCNVPENSHNDPGPMPLLLSPPAKRPASAPPAWYRRLLNFQPSPRTLSGLDVLHVQQRVGAKPDGVYGKKTAEAVRVYQVRHGLHADGVVGPRTASSLG